MGLSFNKTAGIPLDFVHAKARKSGGVARQGRSGFAERHANFSKGITMQINVLEYLDAIAPRLPDKLAFCDDNVQLSFAELDRCSKAIGSALA